MSGSSGLECQQALPRMEIFIPVIVVTANGDVPTSVRAKKAGAMEFLIKPFHDQERLDATNRGVSPHRARRKIEAVRKALR
ncbi:response regulator [Acidomonas methanolica]|uniref:response regulator n=1 Tax=Acidomonas methanolica TaxID=437 RepID=UPI002119C3FB|nr:response regulator [Acidomonas methanolica]MCQ9155415.1 response regulator [Acidomonas methanolica]